MFGITLSCNRLAHLDSHQTTVLKVQKPSTLFARKLYKLLRNP